jgi:outer membrane protein assembly factor BamD (BamD/ComL family)
MYKKLLWLLIFMIAGCTAVQVKDPAQLAGAKEVYDEGLKLIKNREYEESLKYFQYVLDNYKRPQEEKYLSWATYEMGFAYYRMGENEKAIQYFNQVLMDSKTRSPRILANLLKNKIEAGNGYKNASYSEM